MRLKVIRKCSFTPNELEAKPKIFFDVCRLFFDPLNFFAFAETFDGVNRP